MVSRHLNHKSSLFSQVNSKKTVINPTFSQKYHIRVGSMWDFSEFFPRDFQNWPKSHAKKCPHVVFLMPTRMPTHMRVHLYCKPSQTLKIKKNKNATTQFRKYNQNSCQTLILKIIHNRYIYKPIPYLVPNPQVKNI